MVQHSGLSWEMRVHTPFCDATAGVTIFGTFTPFFFSHHWQTFDTTVGARKEVVWWTEGALSLFATAGIRVGVEFERLAQPTYHALTLAPSATLGTSASYRAFTLTACASGIFFEDGMWIEVAPDLSYAFLSLFFVRGACNITSGVLYEGEGIVTWMVSLSLGVRVGGENTNEE